MSEAIDSAAIKAANALHAAEAWLQRRGVDAGVVVVVVAPQARVGLWQPGAQHVAMLGHIDDVAAELCEAAAPVVEHALRSLPEASREAVAAAAGNGAQVQLLLMPAAFEFALRLVHEAGVVELAAVQLERRMH